MTQPLSTQSARGWHTAPDGRLFRVFEGKCLHSACWRARCLCGHWLTKHDFDADGAYNGAIEAMTRRDALDRPDFAHPRNQCKIP